MCVVQNPHTPNVHIATMALKIKWKCNQGLRMCEDRLEVDTIELSEIQKQEKTQPNGQEGANNF